MSDDEIPEDEIDIELRSPAEIGARLVILASLLRRAQLVNSADQEETSRELFDLRHWLSDEGVLSHATDDERRLIEAPRASSTNVDATDVARNGESLAALGWAVGLVHGMAPYDQFASSAGVLAGIPEAWDNVASFISSLHPRSDDLIEAERERAELWLWRAQIEADRQATRGSTRDDIESAIQDVARDADAAKLLPNIANDFLLNGVPFRDLPAETQEIVAIIAERRLHALNWLCGFGEDWNQVPLAV
ncbi:MAG: DUF4272 domain-containing protein [Thermomicrobiales bacterium]